MDPLSTYRDGIYGIEMLREACEKGYIIKYKEDYIELESNGFTLTDGRLVRKHCLTSAQIAECLYEYGIYSRIRLDYADYKVDDVNLSGLTICLFGDDNLERCIPIRFKCYKIIIEVLINLINQTDLIDKIYTILYYDEAKKVILRDHSDHGYGEIIRGHPVNKYLKAENSIRYVPKEFIFIGEY